jgi:hypothetical protein
MKDAHFNFLKIMCTFDREYQVQLGAVSVSVWQARASPSFKGTWKENENGNRCVECPAMVQPLCSVSLVLGLFNTALINAEI